MENREYYLNELRKGIDDGEVIEFDYPVDDDGCEIEDTGARWVEKG